MPNYNIYNLPAFDIYYLLVSGPEKIRFYIYEMVQGVKAITLPSFSTIYCNHHQGVCDINEIIKT